MNKSSTEPRVWKPSNSLAWLELQRQFRRGKEVAVADKDAGETRRIHWMLPSMEDDLGSSWEDWWYMYSWIREKLRSDDKTAWGDQFLFMRRLFGSFFNRTGHAAYVAVIDGRFPFTTRFDESSDCKMNHDLPSDKGDWQLGDARKLELGFGIPSISIDDAVLLRDGAPQDLRLYCRGRDREIIGPRGNILSASDRAFFCCSPDRFSGGDVRRDHVPVMRLAENAAGVYESTTVSLVKFIHPDSAVQLLITLCHRDASTMVVASGERPPEFLMLHYREDNALIHRALGLYDG